jgi:RimJ/RimL family protein N-acetyltransferase
MSLEGDVPELRTERLLLRGWSDADRAPFAAMNADPEVMRHIGPGQPLDRAGSDELLDRIAGHWGQHGHGLWAVEELASGRLLGFAGLAIPWFLPAVLPAVEVGWRLRRDAWGAGCATEAARAALAWGFGPPLGLAEVIATIFPGNTRSQAVARRLGMELGGARPHPAERRPVEVWRLRAEAAATAPGGAPGPS